MNPVPAWVTIVASIVIPILISIPNYLILRQNRKKQEEDAETRQKEMAAQTKRDLSDEAIELYDRMKKEADDMRLRIDELETQADTEKQKHEKLEQKFEKERIKFDEMEAVVSVLETRQQHYEKYINMLVDQLKDHGIEPAKRPTEIDD